MPLVARLACLVFLACGAVAAHASAGADKWIEAQLDSHDEVEVMVRLTARPEKADLPGIGDRLERRSALVNRLRETAASSQAPIRAFLESRRAEYRPYWIVNAIWLRADRDLIADLKDRPDVAYIHANPSVRGDLPTVTGESHRGAAGVEWNVELINAPDVWARGFDGSGAVVGGQDTGYQWDHPALINRYRGWDGGIADHNYNWHDAIHEDEGDDNPCGVDLPAPCDDHGHGTHTLGTMVGDDGGSNQIGVAPGAQWIGCRNMNEGFGTPQTYTECFEWFIAPTDLNGENPDPAKAPHVINNSWSCPDFEGCEDPDLLLEVVQNVVSAGILVVVSAGNSGPDCSSVSTPTAIYDESFTVGATTIDDNIWSLSSRGPVTVDASNRMKPDVSAPGNNVRSSIPGNTYANMSGTSMAAPHVAGLAALMISADSSLAGQVSTMRARIEAHAVRLTSAQTCGGVPGSVVPNNTFGHGRINALDSVLGTLLKQGFE